MGTATLVENPSWVNAARTGAILINLATASKSRNSTTSVLMMRPAQRLAFETDGVWLIP